MIPIKSQLAMLFFCGLPSIALFQRFAQVVAPAIGIDPGMFTFVLLACWCVLAIIILQYVMPVLLGADSWRVHPDLWLLLSMAVLIALQVFIYPLADSGQLGFYSDRDEALDIGARRLLIGEYPYVCRSVSGIHAGCPMAGNPILPLPGALVLSIPFVLIGGSAGQVFLWLVMLYLALRYLLNSPKAAFTYLAAIFVLSPILLAEILTGGDLISNTLAVSSLALLATSSNDIKKQLLFGLLLGVALSWRPHFALIAFPLAAFYITQKKTMEFCRIAAATALGFLAVTLPIYLRDPAHFTPAQSSEKLSGFTGILPYSSIVVPIMAAAIGAYLGSRARSQQGLLYACAITVALPILMSIIMNSIRAGHPTLLFFGWYTLSALVFGTLAAMLPTIASDRRLG